MNVETRVLRQDIEVPVIDALDLYRPRSAGVLTVNQIEWCRRNGIELAYDPMQGGWVSVECEDDLFPTAVGISKTVDDNLRFRSWAPEDAPSYARMLSAERLWAYLPETYAGPIDTATASALISLADEKHHSVSAVERDGVAIGQVRLRFDEPGSAEISYWLGEEYWGKGYGSRVVGDYCEKAFLDHPEITRLFARVHKEHRASQRILEKAGFAHVATDGEWHVLERRRQL